MKEKETINLQKVDPVMQQTEVSSKDRGCDFSPLSPPDANNPPSNVKVEYENLHPYLKQLVDEHNLLKSNMSEFSLALQDLGKNKNVHGKNDIIVQAFFKFFISEFINHNQKEENQLFPLLAKRFLEVGEHSRSSKPITPIDILKSEHLEVLQIGTEAKCTWELLQQLFDPTSQNILLGSFLRKSNTLLEMMKLHIFREDDIVFSLAQKHLHESELDLILKSSQ